MSVLTFDQDAHVYTLDGARVPSVTAILRAAGLFDFSNIPPSILEAARRRGTACHAAIHYYNENDLAADDFAKDFPAYWPYLESWDRLMASGRLEPVLCEHRVASRARGYAGTFDWLGLFDGHAALMDYATGDSEDVAKDLQTAGYLLAAYDWVKEDAASFDSEMERTRHDLLRTFLRAHPFITRYSVRLKKSGACAVPIAHKDPRDFADFTRLLEAQQIVHARRPKAACWTEWEES